MKKLISRGDPWLVPHPIHNDNEALPAAETSLANGTRKSLSKAVEFAEKLCSRKGIALTPSRRRILDILASEGRPLGAYDLIDRVALLTSKRPAPISIYRALDFLLENQLIHRLASRNAYLACGHSHRLEEPIVFLICDQCGDVTETTSESLRACLAVLAGGAQFQPSTHVMEIAGRCRLCASA
jgi:Fur family zinc uptake transcriptional regulator